MTIKNSLFLYLLLVSILTIGGFHNLAFSQLANSDWSMFGHDLKHTGQSPYNGPQNPGLK
jgi:hypothetical protein